MKEFAITINWKNIVCIVSAIIALVVMISEEERRVGGGGLTLGMRVLPLRR